MIIAGNRELHAEVVAALAWPVPGKIGELRVLIAVFAPLSFRSPGAVG